LQDGCLEALVLWPVDLRALFYAKAIANTLLLLLVAAALTPLLLAVYDAPLPRPLWNFIQVLCLGCAALAAPGTLYGLMAGRARASSVLLPLLLFPLVVPALLGAARATTVMMEGDPMGQSGSWIGLLWAFNAVHWSLSGILFSRIVED
jgi:heme exporter protein B